MEYSDPKLIHYQSYLFRLWRDDLGDVRLITLQNTISKKLLHFATLELLFDFLSKTPNDSADTEWIDE